MNYKKNTFLAIVLLLFFRSYAQQFYFIPKQTFNPYEVFGYSSNGYFDDSGKNKKSNFLMTVDSFQISRQITLKEYKAYLEVIKKDSSYNFYVSQLPDSTIISEENYSKYLSEKNYDDFPVVGVRWTAAMNFCRWKTILENPGKKINYIYRLPILSDWLDAYHYLRSVQYSNDFNINYSDWTMNAYYEGVYGFDRDSAFVYDSRYLPWQNDRLSAKRVWAIGDSYLFQRENLIQHAAPFFIFNGYRQVSFRIVREYLNKKESFTNRIIHYWGIENAE